MPDLSSKETPVALSIAGSDSGGGAGIQADLLTFRALGVYGTTAITCTTAQNPDSVISVSPLSPDHVKDQIRQVLDYFDVRAIKTGMLFNAEIIRAVVESLSASRKIPVIVDPVMVSTSGSVLLQPEAIEILTKELFPLATLVTPNLDEVKVLIKRHPKDLQSIVNAARSLATRFQTAFLVKGGHLPGNQLTDVLAFPESDFRTFNTQRISGVNSHGSGCSLASAIAAEIARGNQLEEAIEKAHRFLQDTFLRPVILKKGAFLNHFR